VSLLTVFSILLVVLCDRKLSARVPQSCSFVVHPISFQKSNSASRNINEPLHVAPVRPVQKYLEIVMTMSELQNGIPEAPSTPVPFSPTTAGPDTASSFKCQLYTSPGGFSDLAMLETISSPCSFDAEIFERVMVNLIRNPNITSSHLFRADIFYDSAKDTSFDPDAYVRAASGENGQSPQISTFIKHMRAELRPRAIRVEGYELRRTMVRQMVPRNTKLDKPLPQTCHLFRRQRKTTSTDDSVDHNVVENDTSSVIEEDNLVVYLPHVASEDEIPWYHPKVKALCFLHTSYPQPAQELTAITSKFNTISLHISPFASAVSPSTFPSTKDSPSIPERLTRTLQNLLITIHRHGTGQQKGYQKRVHHDRIIPQARVQDTYTRLKNTYAKDLLEKYWQEVTDATKGIFEDLGIAAFCIELWKEMYASPSSATSLAVSDKAAAASVNGDTVHQKPPFPGFVDIGCGNAVLDFILLSEGFDGWAFDARTRKTWSAFPASVRASLKELVLVPSVFEEQAACFQREVATNGTSGESTLDSTTPSIDNLTTHDHIHTPKGDVRTHNGIFPPGTFIISNHADELTPWTPLIAYLNDSPFISIPCCSHDLTGARFRYAPPVQEKVKNGKKEKQDQVNTELATADDEHREHTAANQSKQNVTKGGGKNKVAQPSAYSTLCSAVARLAQSVGFEPEEEVLRIPSTRNVAIIGRKRAKDVAGADAGSAADTAESNDENDASAESKEDRVLRIIRQELPEHNIVDVAREWRERAAKIAGSKSTKDAKH
jgi:tRNASer (uridine44-2'-O)-methyltransferase